MSNRTSEEVAIRAIILNTTILVDMGAPREQIIGWLKHTELWESATEWEQNFLENLVPSDQDRIKVNHSVESLAVLLWSIKILDKLPSAQGPTPLPEILESMMDMKPDPSVFIQRAELRPQQEIESFNNAAYQMNWEVRDAGLNNKPIPNDNHPVVVQERHKASNWLRVDIFGKVSWDEVTTDT